MLKKEIREFKKGNGVGYRIYISNKDLKELNNSRDINILTNNEYYKISKTNDDLEKKIDNLKQEVENKKNEIAILKSNIQTEKHYKELIKELSQHQETTLEKMDKQHNETIKELNQEQIDYLKQIYDEFNDELKKYITINQLQNQALEQILELGFIDIIRNKHKTIAKDQIKELTTNKVYELTPTKE